MASETTVTGRKGSLGPPRRSIVRRRGYIGGDGEHWHLTRDRYGRFRTTSRENPSAMAWLLGLGVGAVAVIGIVAIATRPSKAAPAPPTVGLMPGHVYRFSALRAPGVSNDALIAALDAVGWKNATIWSYGDANVPNDYNWPPETRSPYGYLAQSHWEGPAVNAPVNLFGIVEIGALEGGVLPPPPPVAQKPPQFQLRPPLHS
jgi:hypothetical protein